MKPVELTSMRPEYENFDTKNWAKVFHKDMSKQIEEKFWIDRHAGK